MNQNIKEWIDMAILTAVQLKKEFVVRTLFSGVSFEIAPRDHVGLIGVNGCGKSTLLKMLLRQEPVNVDDSMERFQALFAVLNVA